MLSHDFDYCQNFLLVEMRQNDVNMGYSHLTSSLFRLLTFYWTPVGLSNER